MLLSDLTSLPSGWTAASNKLSCGSVSTGNGCQLTLNYAPTTLNSGTLSLNYSYLDAGGTYNVGSFNVPYAATTNDNVVGMAAPSGQINAIVGQASPTAAVTFTTDDGRPATALAVTTDLTTLPDGWTSSVGSFMCIGVDGGNGCVLPLTFTPTTAANGSLTLAYKYNNNAGQAKTGTVNIPYVATTDNTVNATASVNSLGVLTGSTTPLNVTFVTDDGNPASALMVTCGLESAPGRLEQWLQHLHLHECHHRNGLSDLTELRPDRRRLGNPDVVIWLYEQLGHGENRQHLRSIHGDRSPAVTSVAVPEHGYIKPTETAASDSRTYLHKGK